MVSEKFLSYSCPERRRAVDGNALVCCHQSVFNRSEQPSSSTTTATTSSSTIATVEATTEPKASSKPTGNN
jgi:hypothetical protein